MPSFPPIYYLSDCMPDCNPGPLDLLLGKPRSNTNFERRLKFPSNVLGCRVDSARHTFQPRSQHPVYQRLNFNVS